MHTRSKSSVDVSNRWRMIDVMVESARNRRLHERRIDILITQCKTNFNVVWWLISIIIHCHIEKTKIYGRIDVYFTWYPMTDGRWPMKRIRDGWWSPIDARSTGNNRRWANKENFRRRKKKNPTGVERKKKRSAITKLKTIQTGNSRLFIFYCHIALLESGSMFSLGYFVFNVIYF